MKKNLLFLFGLVLILGSCRKNTEPSENSNLDCDAIHTAMIGFDGESLANLLNPSLEEIDDLDLDNDACPHTIKLDKIISLLNDNCDGLSTTILCCNCIETFPEISEILVHVDSSGVEVDRILDLAPMTADDNFFVLKGLH